MRSQVWFVRHAESVANAGGASKGYREIPLSENGVRSAADFADIALPARPDLIVVSPFKRAQMTALPTIRRYPDVPVQEWAVGEFHCLAEERFQVATTSTERRPHWLEYWSRADPLYRDGPSSESFADFISRVRFVWDRVTALKAPFTMIFSHGLFMRALHWVTTSEVSDPVTSTEMRDFHELFMSHDIPNLSVLPVAKVGEPPQLRLGDLWHPSIGSNERLVR